MADTKMTENKDKGSMSDSASGVRKRNNRKDKESDSEADFNDEGSVMSSVLQSAADQFLSGGGVLTDKNHPVGGLVVMAKDFVDDSVRLVRRCNKPDVREFQAIMCACGVGLLVMGCIGYFVKLIFIPINNIILGGG